jgi:hypothetical protein
MFVADGQGFSAPEANTNHPLRVRMWEVRRSPQAVACRKRYVEELGRPRRLLRAGSVGGGHTANEARKGKPGDGTMLEPKL